MHFSNHSATVGETISSLLSCLVGLSLITLSGYELWNICSSGGGSMIAIFAYSLFALSKGVVGALFIAPSMTRLLSVPVFKMVDLIYLPSTHEKKPPLNYRLADYYRTTRQFDLAIERYSEIIRYYPGEPVAHAGLYLSLKQTSEAPRKSKRVFRKARRCLRGSESWERFVDLVGQRDRAPVRLNRVQSMTQQG